MPIRTRVQRLWRLVVGWWRTSPNSSPSPAAPATARPSPRRSVAPAPRSSGREPAATDVRHGEPLIAGAVTVRMWVVGGRLLLATSAPEAERALLTLLPELDADGQATARRLLKALRGTHAEAA